MPPSIFFVRGNPVKIEMDPRPEGSQRREVVVSGPSSV